MKINTIAEITQVIELTNNDTNKKDFLILIDNEWQKINQEEYNNIVRGNDND